MKRMGVYDEILKKFQKVIKSWWQITKEHRDYILCKKVYRCSPKDIDEVEESILQLHYDFYNSEKKEEYLVNQREKQAQDLKLKRK